MCIDSRVAGSLSVDVGITIGVSCHAVGFVLIGVADQRASSRPPESWLAKVAEIGETIFNVRLNRPNVTLQILRFERCEGLFDPL